MSKIGISYWGVHDGFRRAHPLDTPDGHRLGRPIFLRELILRGHNVYALQNRREENDFFVCDDEFRERGKEIDETTIQGMIQPLEMKVDGQFQPYDYVNDRNPKPTEIGPFPDLDIIFMEWRWSTWKNDRYHPDFKYEMFQPDLERQREILSYYHGKIPIIAWDTDLKITESDEKVWPELIIADPSFEPRNLTRSRYSLPFWSDFKRLFSVSEPYPIYGYIGNNYERPDEFNAYYFGGVSARLRSVGIQTSMYGNWLMSSPERESPQDIIRKNENVAFNHRMNFYESMQMMNKFICTTHVSKPLYYKHKFMSPRYHEAVAVGCPALTPEGFDPIFGEKFRARANPSDVVEKIKMFSKLTLEERKEVIESQSDSLKSLGLGVENAVDFVENFL